MSITLKEALQAKGWTVQRLADETGISKLTLNNYMNGHRSLPRAEAEKVVRIADALQIDIHELIKR
ncbi:helix-turn-helix domain-containing protein [Beduinella massiliensis]|uniref:helix-turn-helix domain-containing protein n=1 Tax=Beduinella massiliensis TaxID=1852363 RepID=UPI000C82475C